MADQTPDDSPALTETDDPLLTTAQAAAHMGKTYRQFTAYASHHSKVMPREGKPPLYRLSVIEAAVARSQRPAKALSVAAHQDSPWRQTEQSGSTPSAGDSAQVTESAHVIELARRVVELSAKTDALHERIHAKDEQIHALTEAAAAREAEHQAELDRLRAEYEAKREPVSWWGRLLGRG